MITGTYWDWKKLTSAQKEFLELTLTPKLEVEYKRAKERRNRREERVSTVTVFFVFLLIPAYIIILSFPALRTAAHWFAFLLPVCLLLYLWLAGMFTRARDAKIGRLERKLFYLQATVFLVLQMQPIVLGTKPAVFRLLGLVPAGFEHGYMQALRATITANESLLQSFNHDPDEFDGSLRLQVQMLQEFGRRR